MSAQVVNPEVTRLNQLACKRQQARDWDSAERYFRDALDIGTKSEARGVLAVIHSNLGSLYEDEDRYGEAEKQYRLSHELLKAEYGEQDRRVGLMLDKIGKAVCLGGHFSAANSLFQSSVVILRSQKNPNETEIATVLLNIAAVQWLLGNLSKSDHILNEVISLFERAGKDHRPDLALAFEVRARIAEQVGDIPKAQVQCQQALSILEQEGNPEELAAGLITMGQLLLSQSDIQGARVKLDRAHQLIAGRPAEQSPIGAALMSSLARCYHLQGKAGEAGPLFERAIQIDQRVLGPYHPKLLYTMQEYAGFLRATKRKKEAKKVEAYVHEHLREGEVLKSERNVVDVGQLLREQKH
jgi:tetratricopeptide (TPR) repeat protein